jgi:hypothetical protein
MQAQISGLLNSRKGIRHRQRAAADRRRHKKTRILDNQTPAAWVLYLTGFFPAGKVIA